MRLRAECFDEAVYCKTNYMTEKGHVLIALIQKAV